MIKIIRTSRLNVLETYLIGGKIDIYGGNSETINSFDEYRKNLKVDGAYRIELIKEEIKAIIVQYDEKFKYFGHYYKFKFPSEKNLNILAKRILKHLEKLDKQ